MVTHIPFILPFFQIHSLNSSPSVSWILNHVSFILLFLLGILTSSSAELVLIRLKHIAHFWSECALHLISLEETTVFSVFPAYFLRKFFACTFLHAVITLQSHSQKLWFTGRCGRKGNRQIGDRYNYYYDYLQISLHHMLNRPSWIRSIVSSHGFEKFA